MAKTYMATDGDIKEILRTMVHSPEFNSQKYYRVKVKTPLEFVASVFRATDTNPANPGALVGVIGRMGEPLYQMQPPTGYSTTADHWMNSGCAGRPPEFLHAVRQQQGRRHQVRRATPARRGTSARTATRARIAPWWKPGADSCADLRRRYPAVRRKLSDLMEQMLVDGKVSGKINDVIHRELAGGQSSNDPAQTLDTMTALLLGSPEFQMH